MRCHLVTLEDSTTVYRFWNGTHSTHELGYMQVFELTIRVAVRVA